MKEKSSSIDLAEESLAGSKRTESWVNKTTEEIHSAHKTELSPKAAGFKPLRVNPVNQSFQPAISVKLPNNYYSVFAQLKSLESGSKKIMT